MAKKRLKTQKSMLKPKNPASTDHAYRQHKPYISDSRF